MPVGNGQPRTYDTAEASEVPAGDINIDQITQEIADDPALAAVTLDYIDSNANIFDFFFTTTLDVAQTNALDALVFAHTPVEAEDTFQFEESNQLQSTTSETYVEALSFTTPPLKGGEYLVLWNCEMRINLAGGLNSAGQMRLQINGNNKALGSWPHEEWNTLSGIDRQMISENETPTLLLQYRRDPNVGGNDTIEIRRVRLGLNRLDLA